MKGSYRCLVYALMMKLHYYTVYTLLHCVHTIALCLSYGTVSKLLHCVQAIVLCPSLLFLCHYHLLVASQQPILVTAPKFCWQGPLLNQSTVYVGWLLNDVVSTSVYLLVVLHSQECHVIG